MMSNREYKEKHLQIDLMCEKQIVDIYNCIRREYNRNVHQYEVVGIALNYLYENMKRMTEKERRDLLNEYWKIY